MLSGLIGACLLASVAQGGVFTHKTMQGAWPEAQVQRGFVLPRGWLELGLAADTKSTDAYRDSGGVRRTYAGSNWQYSRLWLEVSQGFSSRITLYGRVPWVMAVFEPRGGTTIRTMAMGDAHTGLIGRLVHADTHSVAMQLDLKAPSGVEWPTEYGGGPGATSSFLTGTGITNLGAHVLGRLTVADLIAIRGDAGYVRKFPGIVGYVVQTDGFGNGWLNPGDEVRIGGEIAGQLGSMISVTAGTQWSHRGVTRVSVSGEGTTNLEMQDVAQTKGAYLDAEVAVSVEPADHWELEVRAGRDLMGVDTRTFAHLGLEELSPQPGWTLGMRMVSRW